MRSSHPFVFALILLAGCTTQQPSTQRSPHEKGSQQLTESTLDSIVNASMARGPIAGVSVTVLSGSEPLISKGYGTANFATQSPATAATSYRIGSVSKMITALAVMRLVERGAFALDDSVRTLLPEATIDSGVTVRHLLNHTSGLPDHEREAVERWMGERLPITKEFVLRVVSEESGAGDPGTAWRYTSSSFHLLGIIIEKVAGIPYQDFVQREIAEPLGLTTLRLCSGAEPVDGQARDYVVTESGYEPDAVWDLPGIFSAGGMCASSSNVATLVRGFASGQIVSATTRQTMLTPTDVAGNVRADSGLGVTLGALEGEAKWGHTGGGAYSNRAVAAHYPDADVTIVVLMNSERDESQATAIDVEAQIARAVLGIGPPDLRGVALDHPFARYTGTYGEGPGLSEIRVDDGKLTYKRLASSADPSVMLYQGNDEFFPFDDAPEFRFRFQIADQTAVALVIYEGGWFRGLRLKVQ